jgi:hypothetical protein
VPAPVFTPVYYFISACEPTIGVLRLDEEQGGTVAKNNAKNVIFSFANNAHFRVLSRS